MYQLIGRGVLALALLSTWAATAQDQTAASLTSQGELRVALIMSNPVLVTLTPEGLVNGVSVDIATALEKKLGIPVRFVQYENPVRYNQSIGKDEWDVGLSPRDLSRIGQLAFSDPFMEVDNSYVARPGMTLRTPDEVDRAGIRVAVDQGSATDGYLTRTLRHAEIVRLAAGGLVSAKEALSFGRADVYADYTSLAYRLQAELPGATVLVAPFNIVRLCFAVPKSKAKALPTLNEFVHDAKQEGVISQAIKNAGLRGARPGR
jgi:polar amino acid transport system substrate-binding protein